MTNYQQIDLISRNEAEVILKQVSPEAIALCLVRLAYHDPDWMWVQDVCIALSTHQDKWVRRNCATCFSHLARIRGKLEIQKVMPVLNRLLQDPDVKGEAEDAINDLAVFIK